MGHAVLLGDSLLDNGAYVSGSPVAEQLRSRLPRDWQTTLLARDGAVATGVLKQLQKLPADASHLIVSAGGNDALESIPLFRSPVADSQSMLLELVALQDEFRSNYRKMIRALRETRRPTIACTIYDAVPSILPVEKMALSLFNDVIKRVLIEAHIPILDMRLVCNEFRDFSSVSQIEPSEIGGSKISRALQRILLDHDFARSETVVYP